MRARHRLALVAAGSFCLAASVYVTATRPSAVEARLRELLASSLRAPCTFDGAEFGFLDGLTVSGLRVLDPEDPLRPPLVDVGRARLDFNLDLLGRGPHITVVHLQRPAVRLTADRDGLPSLLAIAARPEPGAPGVALPVIRIVDGRVELDGPPLLAPGDTATLTSIRADVLAADGRIRVPEGHARSDALGPLTFSLDLTDDGSATSASVGVAEIDLERLVANGHLAAVREAVERHAATGRVGVQASIDLVDGVATRLDADVRLSDLRLKLALPDRAGLPPPEPLSVSLAVAHATLHDGRLVLDEATGTVLGGALDVTGSAELGRVIGVGADVPPRLDLTLGLRGARVAPAIEAHVPLYLQRIRQAYALEGVADATFRVRGPLEEPSVEAHLDVREARASYEGHLDGDTGERHGFPWYAEDLVGTVDILPHRVAFAGRGRHGAATVAVEGFTDSTSELGSHTEVRVVVDDVQIDDDVRNAFGDGAERALGPWRPEGAAQRVEVLVESLPDVAGGETATHVVLHLDGRAAFTPDVLPVPLREARGVIRILEPAVDGHRVSRVLIQNLSATGDGFALAAADGVVVGEDEDVRVRFEVDALEGAFGRGVLASNVLTDGTKRAVRLLSPRGRATVDAHVLAADGSRGDVVVTTLRGVDVAGWEGVPLAARGLEGIVRYEDDALATEWITGEVLDGARVRIAGTLSELSRASVPRLDISARDVPLDARLRDALGTLAEPARAVWDELAPSRDLRGDVAATVRPPGAREGELSFRVDELRGGVRVLGLELGLRSGHVEYESGAVHGTLAASRGAGEIAVDAFTYHTASGDVDTQLSARGLAFPDDLVPLLAADAARAVSASLSPSRLHLPRLALGWDAAARRLAASGTAALRVTEAGAAAPGLHVRASIELDEVVAQIPEDGPATVEGRARLAGTSLDPGVEIAELAGGVAFRGALGGTPSTFELDMEGGSARLLGLLLDPLALRLEIEGGQLRLPDVRAGMYGGELEGRFNRGGERLAYRGSFDVRDVDLARYAEDRQREAMAGKVDGEVRIRNTGGAAGELEGAGTVSVSGAEIRVPWISAALRAMNSALLGIAAIQGDFHAGAIEFDLRGRRMLVRKLHFEGPSVPLLLGATLELQDGQGAIDLVDGRLDLAVYPRVKLGVLGLDPTGIFDRIVGLAQFMVRRLRIEGTTRNPRTTWEVISGELDEELRPRPRPIGDVRRYGPEPW